MTFKEFCELPDDHPDIVALEEADAPMPANAKEFDNPDETLEAWAREIAEN